MRIQKVCEECGGEFTAKTTVTRCCGDPCATRLYKRRKREERFERYVLDTRRQKIDTILHKSIDEQPAQLSNSTSNRTVEKNTVIKEFLNTAEMAFVIGVSKRSLQRLLTIRDIPRIYIGKRILFRKEEVLNYLQQQQKR